MKLKDFRSIMRENFFWDDTLPKPKIFLFEAGESILDEFKDLIIIEWSNKKNKLVFKLSQNEVNSTTKRNTSNILIHVLNNFEVFPDDLDIEIFVAREKVVFSPVDLEFFSLGKSENLFSLQIVKK